MFVISGLGNIELAILAMQFTVHQLYHHQQKFISVFIKVLSSLTSVASLLKDLVLSNEILRPISINIYSGTRVNLTLFWETIVFSGGISIHLNCINIIFSNQIRISNISYPNKSRIHLSLVYGLLLFQLKSNCSCI